MGKNKIYFQSQDLVIFYNNQDPYMNFFKTLLLISCVTLAITLKVPKHGYSQQNPKYVAQSWCNGGSCWGFLESYLFQCTTGYYYGQDASQVLCESNSDCYGANVCVGSGQKTTRGWCSENHCWSFDESLEVCSAGEEYQVILECSQDYDCSDVRYCVE